MSLNDRRDGNGLLLYRLTTRITSTSGRVIWRRKRLKEKVEHDCVEIILLTGWN
jgi:hypothetical protein